MGLFSQPFKFGTSGDWWKNVADPGSMLFGGAGQSNSLGQARDGVGGNQDRLIDWFGSPNTAGTDAQEAARLAAIIYGGWMAAGAGGASSAASKGMTAANYGRMGYGLLNPPQQPNTTVYGGGLLGQTQWLPNQRQSWGV